MTNYAIQREQELRRLAAEMEALRELQEETKRRYDALEVLIAGMYRATVPVESAQ